MYITLSTKNTLHFPCFHGCYFPRYWHLNNLKKKITNVWVIEEYYVYLLNVLQ